MRDPKIIRGRKRFVERPLLGRYFFAEWRDGCQWRGLLNLRLVNGLFTRVDAELPALVPDAEIDHLKKCEDDNGYVTGIVQSGFAKGQKVRATTGLFANMVGEYHGAGRNGVDAALLELFGRATRIEFAAGVLVAA